MEKEIEALRAAIKQQDIQITATGAMVLSLFDLLTQVLETRGIADRAEIADRLFQIILRERNETQITERERGTQLFGACRDIEGQKLQHRLLEGVVCRLMPAPSPPPKKPVLRAINGKE
jgi:hypothetical protein